MSIRTLSEKFMTRNPFSAYTKLFFAAAIYTIGIQSFLNIGGTFSAGLGAFGQLISFLFDGLHSYFSLVYIGLNIPLIILFSTKLKLKKSFIYRTTFFLLIQALLGMVYLIPDAHDWLTNLMDLGENGQTDTEAARTTKKWAILIYAVIGAILVGISAVTAWKNGGSTAGTDFVGYYFSTKKKQAIGSVLFKISISIAVFSIAMVLIANPKSMYPRTNWVLLTVATVTYVGITSVMMNLLYPKYSKVRLEIHSFKTEEISEFLKNSGFKHGYNVQEFVSGYTGNKRKQITSVMLLLEVKSLVRALYKIDSKIWISETRVRRVFGTFSTQAVDT